MIRAKIRYQDPKASGKVITFDPSVEFDALLLKIANKLQQGASGVPIIIQENNTVWIRQTYALRLVNDNDPDDEVYIEDASEIQENDNLILVERKKDSNDDARGPAVVTLENSATESESTSSAKQKENKNHDSETENDNKDSEVDVEDITEQEKAAAQKKKMEQEVIVLSSDDESDEEDSDGEGPVDIEDIENDDLTLTSNSSEEEQASEYSDFDEEENDIKPRTTTSKKAKAKKPAPVEPTLEVLMDAKDVPSAPGKRNSSPDESAQSDNQNNGMEEVSTLVDGAGRKKADQDIKERIMKLLNTGFHDQSNENEAKNAMKIAQKLMRKHNLSQALLLKEREDRLKHGTEPSSNEILKGGVVEVNIQNRKTGKPSLFARWINNLTNPVAENFDVKCFYSCRRGARCSVTFYGIYTNAQLAGYAFKVATERISQMMAEYQPEKRGRNQRITTQSSRLSYALGMVRGIQDEVDRAIQAEKEKRQRKLQRARLAMNKGEAYEESDDEDDDEGKGADNIIRTGFANSGGADDDSDGPKFASSSSPAAATAAAASDNTNNLKPANALSGEDINRRIQELEAESQSAIVLVNHKEKVAEQVLKDNGIKLSKGRKRKSICFDHDSYEQGIEDAKEIDINQRAIRDEVKVKGEKKFKKERA